MDVTYTSSKQLSTTAPCPSRHRTRPETTVGAVPRSILRSPSDNHNVALLAKPRRSRWFFAGFSPHTRSTRNLRVRSEFNLDDLLEMPSVDGDLFSLQEQAGATFSDDDVALSYGNDLDAWKACQEGTALIDRSHWGRLRIAGEDRIRFLNNLSTQDLTLLKPGQGADTVFVTPLGRIIDLATVYVQDYSVMVVVSPEEKDTLLEHMEKHIFPADNVTIMDVSDKCCMLSLLGPWSEELMAKLGYTAGSGQEGSDERPDVKVHQLLNFQGSPVMVASGSGLPSLNLAAAEEAQGQGGDGGHGFTVIVDQTIAGDLWEVLMEKGAVLMGDQVWEQGRAWAGRPRVGSELSRDRTPLEAGLYHAISLDKGCYMGQETLAKVHNNKGVLQQLCGLWLDGPVPAGTTLRSCDDAKLTATVTTVADPAFGVPPCESSSIAAAPTCFALAYVRCRSGGKQIDIEGTQWTIAGEGEEGVTSGVKGIVGSVPFVTRQFAGEPPLHAEVSEEVATPAVDPEQAGKDEAAKTARLKAMEERVAAWQAQQQQGSASQSEA